VRDSPSVYTLLVREKRLCAVPARSHYKLLAMTRSASFGNVRVADTRVRISGGEQLMRTPMAVAAGCGLGVPCRDCFRMKAALVGSLLVGVARLALNLRRFRFMGRALQVGVAIHAREHRAMHGALEFASVDKQADGLAVPLGRKPFVSM